MAIKKFGVDSGLNGEQLLAGKLARFRCDGEKLGLGTLFVGIHISSRTDEVGALLTKGN